MAPSRDDDSFELFTSVRYDAALRLAAGNAALAHAGWNYAQSSPYYMLDLHRDRLLRAATHWRWDAAVSAMAGEAGLRRLEAVLEAGVRARAGAAEVPSEGSPEGPFRCRVTLGPAGQLACEVFPGVSETPLTALFPKRLPAPDEIERADETTETPETPYVVTVDAGRTAVTPFTHYKTTRRQVYDAARQRAGIAGPAHKEVLLVDADSGAVMDGSISTVYLWRGGRWVTPPVPPAYGSPVRGSGGLDGTTRRWALDRGLAVEEDVPASSLQSGDVCWLSNGVRGFMLGRIQRPADAPGQH